MICFRGAAHGMQVLLIENLKLIWVTKPANRGRRRCRAKAEAPPQGFRTTNINMLAWQKGENVSMFWVIDPKNKWVIIDP